MFRMSDLKIKNKISLVFIFVIVMEGILLTVAYKGMENITSIKEAQNNMIIVTLFSMVITIALGLLLINLIHKPMKKLNHIANNIKNGDFNDDIDIKDNDEIGELANSFKIILKNINNLGNDSNLILKSVEKGDFNINLEKPKYNGTWKYISENNFKIADIFIKNIKTTSDYISKISTGQISAKYNQEEVGEFNIAKNNINQLIDNLNTFEDDIHWLKETFKAGNTRDKIDVSKFQGVYKEMAECINDTIWISIDVFIKLFAVLQAYAKGDFSVELEKFQGRYGLVNENIENLRQNLLNISMEQINIANEIKLGNLSKRVEVAQFTGSWAEMINGINGLIEAFVEPINVTADYVKRISNGDLPEKIETIYHGEFNQIKNNLNLLIDSLNMFVKDINWMNGTFKLGNTRDKIDISKFNGVYKEMAQSVNDGMWISIDVLIKMFAVLKSYSEGDLSVELEELPGRYGMANESLHNLSDNLNMFVKDVNWMNETFKLGNTRDKIDISKFNGVYKQMAQSVNDGMWISVDVLIKMFAVLKSYSEGDFSAELEKLPGRYGMANESLHDLRINILNVSDEQMRILTAAAEGNLEIRGETQKFTGSFKELINTVNKAIDAFAKPIREIDNALGEMAKGNLDICVENIYLGDYATMINALNSSIQTMDQVLTDINAAANDVASGSSQVSDGSQALSQGATEQASAIEQLTSSITEVAAQTKENAVNANQAKDLALKVKENAENGNRHMSEMLKSMGEINESSANISKIIKVIDEIAFQTNILALNAAVEAARAGQHGKGFAVVAEEVRNLAARSANAAKETTDLIEGSIKKAEKGTDIANNTAKALYEIVDGVSKAAILVAEIAASSNEQATGISQINIGVEQVSQVVQTNSATAEESAAASEELSSQSELLKGMVSSFKLKNSNSNGNSSSSLNNRTRNKQYYSKENNIAFKEVAVTLNKPKIALSDNEFGKY